MRPFPSLLMGLLLTATFASAGSPDDPELADPRADAHAPDLDLLRVWFAAAEGEPPGCADALGGATCLHHRDAVVLPDTWLHVELAGFERPPPGTVYGVRWLVGDARVSLSHAYSVGGPPGGTFGACVEEARDEATLDGGARHGDCMALEGERLADRPGFRVRLGSDLAPPGLRLDRVEAAVFTMPPHAASAPLPYALLPWTPHDAAGPGRTYFVPAPEPAAERVMPMVAQPPRETPGAPLAAVLLVLALAASALSGPSRGPR